MTIYSRAVMLSGIYKLESDGALDITNPQNNDLIKYDSATGKWINFEGRILTPTEYADVYPSNADGNIAKDAGSNDVNIGGVESTVVIKGDLKVEGGSTHLECVTFDVVDPQIEINTDGNDTSAEGAGILIKRTTTDAVIAFDSTLTNKFKIGLVGSEKEIAVLDDASQIPVENMPADVINAELTGITSNTITLNKDGDDETAESSGLIVERETQNASLVFDSTLETKWKAGLVGEESQILTAGMQWLDIGEGKAATDLNGNAGLRLNPTDAECTGFKYQSALASKWSVGTESICHEVVSTGHTQTLTNKTLTTPTISDLTNANHNHSGASSGGTISHTALTDKGTNTHAQIDTHLGSTSNPHSTTLQQAYDANIDPEILLNNTSGQVTIKDASTPITGGHLFEVVKNDGTKYFAVDVNKVIVNDVLDTRVAQEVDLFPSAGANNINVGGVDSTVIIKGNLTVEGTVTAENSESLAVEDAYITLNVGGDQTSADDQAGIYIEMSDATNVAILYDKDKTSKFGIGEYNDTREVVTVSHTQTLTNKTLTIPVITDFSSAPHDHSNTANGGKVSHLDLDDAGTFTHAQLDGAFVSYPEMNDSVYAKVKSPELTYTAGKLTLITYSSGYTKTFAYDGDTLTSITFDKLDEYPTTVKTFNYTDGVLVSIIETEV